jgi:pimeloyl-ACP methyl ester carboxylesterase
VTVAGNAEPGKTTNTWLDSNGLKIAACFSQPVPDPTITVVFCGGFKSNMQGTKALALEQWCQCHKWPYVRFDYSGHGQSEGAFTDGNIDVWLHDTLTVIDAIDSSQSVLLIGSSMGAWIATLAALKRPGRIAGLITLAAAPDFTEQLLNHRLNQQQRDALQRGQAVAMPSEYDDGSPYPITQQLIENSHAHCLLDSTHALDIPVRLLHGTHDEDVPYETSIALLSALQCDDARLTLIKNADHRLSSASDIALLQNTLTEMLDTLQR